MAALVGGAGLAAACSPALAAGHQFFSVGGGAGLIANDQPCADIPCNGGDTCSCTTASGTLTFSTLEKKFKNGGSFTVEVSTDKSTGVANGAGGACFTSAGMMTLTSVRGTLSIPFAGPACRLGVGGGGPDAVPFGMSAAAYVASGTGGYTNPVGTGTLAITINGFTKQVTLDLVGYGSLSN